MKVAFDLSESTVKALDAKTSEDAVANLRLAAAMKQPDAGTDRAGHRAGTPARRESAPQSRSLRLDWPSVLTKGTFERIVRSTSMSKVPAIVPVSDLRGDAASILDRVKKSREPVVITQRGRAAAVMVSVEEYERAAHERELLRLLAQGDKEAATGKGHDLEDVLREADRVLAR
jgi:prevent-host-death family protein